VSATMRLLANNARYAANFPGPPPVSVPDVAVVTCMDHRIDLYAALGLTHGQAQLLLREVASDS
jgi:carbonic anhydrase